MAIKKKITGSEEDQKIWKYIIDNGLEDKIVFTGFKHGNELVKLISRATCIVCPAIWYENMPNTVIEAYAYGKPVVASRIGSLEEMVVDGETGFLFEMKNAEDMSQRLKLFLDNQTLSSTLGRQARNKCEKAYNEEIHITIIY